MLGGFGSRLHGLGDSLRLVAFELAELDQVISQTADQDLGMRPDPSNQVVRGLARVLLPLGFESRVQMADARNDRKAKVRPLPFEVRADFGHFNGPQKYSTTF